MNKILIFVCGNLKKGQKNNQLLSNEKFIGNGTTKGKFVEDVNYISRKKEVSEVKGEVYEISGFTLRKLDKFQGHPDWNSRETTNVFLEDGSEVNVWSYFYPGKDFEIISDDEDFSLSVEKIVTKGKIIMITDKQKTRLFNQCVNEFKSKHRRITSNDDISEIKKKRSEILEKAEPYVSFIIKSPESYKEIIRQEFAEIVAKSVSQDYQKSQKEFKVEKEFDDYVQNFWKREEMKKPHPFKAMGWGGAGLIISDDKTWVGHEGDIAIHTDDARISVFTKEIFELCREIIEFTGGKYVFCEIIGKTLQKFQKEDQALIMNRKVFNAIVKGLRGFIETSLMHIQEHNEELERYSRQENYL